ncbi:MAG: phosphatase PAP2 family protein [candidate division Zixibacteria bacterium]
MIERILEYDTMLFQIINSTLANPVTDFIMPIITNDWLLRILYALIVITLLTFGKKKFVWVVVFSAITVAITDLSSAGLIKPLVERMRPCRALDVHLLVRCGPGFAFPSAHTANLFGQALFFGLLYKKYRWYFMIFAFLVGISRVFVGVHYPLDVLGGAVLGCFAGGFCVSILIFLDKREKLKPRPYVE